MFDKRFKYQSNIIIYKPVKSLYILEKYKLYKMKKRLPPGRLPGLDMPMSFSVRRTQFQLCSIQSVSIINIKIHDLRSTSSCISEESCISDERYSGDGAYAEIDFTEDKFANRIKELSVDSSTDVKQNNIKDLEELDRQNAEFDQSNDTDEIAIVARLAADGAER